MSTSDDAVKPEVTVPDVARWLAALAMLGAAVIHFAFAPAHLSDQTSHGLFFLVVAWAQLLGAIALGFDWRPQRPWLLGTAALNTAGYGQLSSVSCASKSSVTLPAERRSVR